MPEEITVLRIGTLIEKSQGLVLDFKPGVLPNTSVVLEYLAHNEITPFVIHTYLEDSGVVHTGIYCRTLKEATHQYALRVA